MGAAVMCSRLEAIEAALPQLLAVLKHNSDLLLSFSQACQDKGILSSDTHQFLVQSTKKKEEKTLYFLHDLWRAVKSEDAKRKWLVQVLRKEKALQPIYKQIKRDIKDRSEENITCIPSQETSCVPSKLPSTLVAGQCATPRLRRVHLSPDDRYNIEMDENQHEAVVRDLQDRMEDLQEECHSKQVEKENALHEKAELEYKLNGVKDELTNITTERDTLNCSNEFLRDKIATLEKFKHIDREKTKQQVSELDRQIHELENQKAKLQTEFGEATKRYQQRKEAAKLVETIDDNYKWKLEKLTMEKEEREKHVCHLKNQLTRRTTCIYFIIALLTLAAILVIIIKLLLFS